MTKRKLKTTKTRSASLRRLLLSAQSEPLRRACLRFALLCARQPQTCAAYDARIDQIVDDFGCARETVVTLTQEASDRVDCLVVDFVAMPRAIGATGRAR